MPKNRKIALNYLGRFKDEVEDCLYYIDKEVEPKIYEGVADEIKCIETTIKMINELEIE